MYIHRYSRWDGTQQIMPLDADELMEALSEDLLFDGDIWSALQRLMRWGDEGRLEERIKGLQQLLEQLRARRQEQLERYNLNSTLDDIIKRLEKVVETERAGIERRLNEGRQRLQEEAAQSPEGQPSQESQNLQKMLENLAARKQDFLNNLPQSPGGQIKALSDYEFMDDDARQQFQELLQMLQQQMMQSYFRGLQQAMQSITPEDLRRLREMIQDLNQMLRQRAQGIEPDFQSFMQRYGQFFPGVHSLDELLQQLQQRMAQMQSLLDSMSPEMRQQLQQLMDSLLQDQGLRNDLAELAALLDQIMPMRNLRNSYPFQGDEPVTLTEALRLMEQLQQMDQLERELKRAQGRLDLDNIDPEKVQELLGEEARQDLEQLKRLAKLLEDAGYVLRQGNTFELTPQGIRKIGQKALRDIFANLKRDAFGHHETSFRGIGVDKTDETKSYEFGDPFLLDIPRTVMNSLIRDGAQVPVSLVPQDFEVYKTELLTQSSTVLMLDMSRSMLMRGCFLAAKKVALALDNLIRTQFPKDNLYVVGFAYYAREINPAILPKLDWDEYMYGTNMQHGFMLARQLLSKHKAGTRQVIVITDGEPTAHFEGGRVYFAYPPTARTFQETLREVLRCTRDDIRINIFMLARSPYLVDFVNKMTKINKGRAFFATPDHLGEYILVDYVNNKRRTIK